MQIEWLHKERFWDQWVEVVKFITSPVFPFHV